ncbi:MAG: carboxyltransferase domain-containing protein [Limnobacter sp.]|nr:carboxyltransferase domain-containing protein [Limnobacter sp.]
MSIAFVCQPVSDSLVEVTARDLSLDSWIHTLHFLQSLHFPWGLAGELEIILADQSISCVLPHHWQLDVGVNAVAHLIEHSLESAWRPQLVRSISKGKPLTQNQLAGRHVAPKVHSIPVQLGGDLGPDLPEVLQTLGLSFSEFSRLLFGAELTVQFLGFLPGFAYLTGLPAPLASLPRRESPRLQIPAQTFAMAGGYCAVYPLQSPGGWNLLGGSAINPFDVSSDPPALFQAGDKVRLVPMTPDRGA